MKDEPQHQDELDRQARVAPLPARCGSPRRPLGNRSLVEPQRKIATALQPSLVSRPVLDSVPSPGDGVKASMMVFKGQGVGSTSAGSPPTSPVARPLASLHQRARQMAARKGFSRR